MKKTIYKSRKKTDIPYDAKTVASITRIILYYYCYTYTLHAVKMSLTLSHVDHPPMFILILSYAKRRLQLQTAIF